MKLLNNTATYPFDLFLFLFLSLPSTLPLYLSFHSEVGRSIYPFCRSVALSLSFSVNLEYKGPSCLTIVWCICGILSSLNMQ